LSQHGDLGCVAGGVSYSLGGCAPIAFTGKFTLKLADAGYKRLDINRAMFRYRFCYLLRAMREAVTPHALSRSHRNLANWRTAHPTPHIVTPGL
jgi:hypothetical protein